MEIIAVVVTCLGTMVEDLDGMVGGGEMMYVVDESTKKVARRLVLYGGVWT